MLSVRKTLAVAFFSVFTFGIFSAHAEPASVTPPPATPTVTSDPAPTVQVDPVTNEVATQPTASTGPEIKISDDELNKETDSEPELKRLGTFGKMHFFGYGELHYNGRMGPSENEVDFHRLVLGFGYDFTDWLQMRAELDFEHAFTEPELEYAYLDFLIEDYFNVRAGAVLMPIGVYNQHHEPPLFYSVERPELYRVIIPTTWQEAGAGFHGSFGKGFEYEAYGVSSLSAVEIEGNVIEGTFTGSDGLRGGRQRIARAPGRDFGFVGRLAYKGLPGLRVGGSTFMGNTGQGNGAIDGGFLMMLEADAKYSIEGLEFDAAMAFTDLTDAGNINNYIVSVDPTFTDFVASQMFGWYFEAAYHVFHHLLPDSKQDVVVFARFEDFNTQHSMPEGFAANPENDRNLLTFGVSYMPIPQVAVKVDYMANWNAANGGVDQFNLGIGFYY